MSLCNFTIVLLAVLSTNGLYFLKIFNGTNSTNTSENIVPNKGNGGNEVRKILSEKRPSLKELCTIINDSNRECTCENFKDFYNKPTESRAVFCNRYWDKVEGGVRVTVSFFGVLGNTLVLLTALKT